MFLIVGSVSHQDVGEYRGGEGGVDQVYTVSISSCLQLAYFVPLVPHPKLIGSGFGRHLWHSPN